MSNPSPLTVATTEALRQIAEAPADPARLVQALRHLAKWRSELVANTLLERSGTRVLGGPFAGMDYPVRASEGARAARLIGCYEASLSPVIETIITRGYDLVIDVGCAEGYYAVGLARRMPQARVLARDDNPRAQVLCRALAEANGVADRIEIGGRLDHAGFDLCRDHRAVVICDIEGAEEDLLDPARAPGLLCADILVECHDGMRAGLSDRLAARFAATHSVQRIGRRLDPDALPDWMEELGDLDRLLALWEWRAGPTPWLWMVRR